jgi:hypothetical protein
MRSVLSKCGSWDSDWPWVSALKPQDLCTSTPQTSPGPCPMLSHPCAHKMVAQRPRDSHIQLVTKTSPEPRSWAHMCIDVTTPLSPLPHLAQAPHQRWPARWKPRGLLWWEPSIIMSSQWPDTQQSPGVRNNHIAHLAAAWG